MAKSPIMGTSTVTFWLTERQLLIPHSAAVVSSNVTVPSLRVSMASGNAGLAEVTADFLSPEVAAFSPFLRSFSGRNRPL